MAKKIFIWLIVTAVFYATAYFTWQVSPFLSFAFAVAHAVWHVRFTDAPALPGESSEPEGVDDSTYDVAGDRYHTDPFIKDDD